MNPFVIAGICAGAFLYGGIRTLARGRKSKGTPDTGSKTKAADGLDQAQESVSSPLETSPALREVPEMADEVDTVIQQVETAEDPTVAAGFPQEEMAHEPEMAIPFSGSKEKHWFLIKSKDGKVRVCQAWEKTPKTIAGPFPTKEEAWRAKEL